MTQLNVIQIWSLLTCGLTKKGMVDQLCGPGVTGRAMLQVMQVFIGQFSVVLEFLLASHGSTENPNLSLFLQVRFISMTIPLPISTLDNVVDSLILPSEPTQEEMTCNSQSLPQEPSLSMLLTAAKSGWTDQSSNLYLTSIVLTCTATV